MTIEVSIPKVEDGADGATFYVISVARDGRQWTARQRYSAFDDLRKKVEKEMGALGAAFPGKSLFGRADPNKRREQLETWLKELCGSFAPGAAASALAAFLAEPEASRPAAGDQPVVVEAKKPPPAPAWDPTFMSSDPLAGLDAAPPAAPPAAAPAPKAEKPKPKAVAAPAHCGKAPSFLVGGGAKTYDATGEGLRDAVKNGDERGVADVLRRDPALSTYQDRQMETMLHLAAIFNHVSIAVRLVEAGANVDAKNQDGETPLDVAQPSLSAKLKAAAEARG